ncbi:MAG TPA: hypothetical protein VEK13_02700 [Thermoplasmata archaeon]|nr:hypothetical protein [Thermoplasmata archaeon]
MDPQERARKEHERVMKARERLKFRVYAAARSAVLATEFFRSHSELYEPEIVVNVYAPYVDVNASLTEGQVRLLPVNGRSRELTRFAEELRVGLQRAATSLGLEFTEDLSRYGGSQPVMLVDVPCGIHAILLRHGPE